MSRTKPGTSARLNPVVFFSSASVVLLLSALMVRYPATSERWLERAQALSITTFGWYYMLVIVACLGFVVWLAFARVGQVRLGQEDERPQFSYLAWISMLFSSGIGIALLYYGVYEPLDHFLAPPEGNGGTAQAAREALVLTFLHWGLHGWALYALLGVTLGYFAYRKNLPLALRSALYPLFGERIHGAIGHCVDTFGILATLVSMVTNLGIGALVIQSGLGYLFGWPPTTPLLLWIVGVMLLAAAAVVTLGVERGIAVLSHLNVRLLCLFLLFVLISGPTRHLLDALVQNTGDYLAAFVRKSFDLYLYDAEAKRWSGTWTLFYWAWWIAWAPFVGMFIARISRGRRIGEVVRGVLLIPLGFTLTWLSIFGNTAIDLILKQGQSALGVASEAEPALALFKFLEYLPLSPYVAGAGVVIAFTLFLTPVDSGTLMIANLSSRGGVSGEDAPIWLRVFWALVTGVVSVGLLLAGSFNAMQIAVVLCGLPFSGVLLLYMLGLRKALAQEA